MVYNGSIDLLSGITPANNNNYPMVAAKDVYIKEDTSAKGWQSLSEWTSENGGNFNLKADKNHCIITSSLSLGRESDTVVGLNSAAIGTDVAATRLDQFVVGAYNTVDPQGSNNLSKGKYLFIIGNGTSAQSRANAFAVGWDGNADLSGKLTVGANPTNNMDVATKIYVDGQIITLANAVTLISQYFYVAPEDYAVPTDPDNPGGDEPVVPDDPGGGDEPGVPDDD